MIKRFFEQRKQRRKEQTRKRLQTFVRYCRKNDNKGLLLNALVGLREVRSVRLITGMFSYADVTMTDGFTLTGYGTWDYQVLRDAAVKVVQRIRAVNRG
jgi:hypothetical protein